MLTSNRTLRSKTNGTGPDHSRKRRGRRLETRQFGAIKAVAELLESRVLLSGATLVDNINKVTLSSNPSNFAVAGNELFFRADDGIDGPELWKSDGTPNGTVMVRDLVPGSAGSSPTPFAALGNDMFFTTAAGGLYITDGTAVGTTQLSSVQPNVKNWTVSNGRLYFQGIDAVHGSELWTSDGTAAGTFLLADISSGAGSSSPSFFAPLNGQVYFAANTATSGNELWKTDGTAAGTTLVDDIYSGSGSSNPTALTTMNGKLYFIASSVTYPSALYVSDGTAAGTHVVSTVSAKALASNTILSVIGNWLYFVDTVPNFGQQLMKTDGTATGTVSVLPTAPTLTNFSAVYALNGFHYVWTSVPTTGQTELWRTDDTPQNTTYTIIGSSPIVATVATQNCLYFADLRGSLWRDDGSGNIWSIVVVNSYGSNSTDQYSTELANLNGTILFNGGTGGWNAGEVDIELRGVVSESAQSVLIKDINAQEPNLGSNPTNFIRAGNQAFFIANDGTTQLPQLWVTDGTEPGTRFVTQMYFQYPLIAAPLGNSILYINNDGRTSRNGLWKTDGTPGGTVMVKDDVVANAMTSAGNLVYFNNGATSGNLWVSDGTTAGTHPLANVAMLGRVAVGNEIYFQANDGIHGNQLWKSDGTTQGTVMVSDFTNGISIGNLVDVAGTLYLQLVNASGAASLWKSDGTTAGTVEITDFSGQLTGSFANLTVVEDELYFTSNIGTNEVELWKTDGTTAGTQMIGNWNSGSGGLSPQDLEAMGNALYFTAPDSTGQWELFKTDGTQAGTIQLTSGLHYQPNIFPDNQGVRSLTAVDNTLFFVANDGVHGNELWSSDGTAAGTAMVQDIGPGDSIGGPSPQIVPMDHFALFAASDSQIGIELWRAEAVSAPPSTGSISGTIFYDANGNGLWDSGEGVIHTWNVFLDMNDDGIEETGEPETTCNIQGQYSFTNLPPGLYRVQPMNATNWTETSSPGGTQYVIVPPGQAVTNVNIGQISGAATVTASPTAIFTGESYSLNLFYSDYYPATSWTINWGDGSGPQTISGSPSTVSHVFAVNSGNSPFTIRAWANSFDGSAPAQPVTLAVYSAPVLSNGALSLIGTSGDNSVDFEGYSDLVMINIDGAIKLYNASLVTKISYTGNGGDDTINLAIEDAPITVALNLTSGNNMITNQDAGPVTVAAGTGATILRAWSGTITFSASTTKGVRELDFSYLSLEGGAKVVFANSSATLGDYSRHANRSLVVVDSNGLGITSGSTLDLGDNSMLLKYSSGNKTAADGLVRSLLTSGYAGGAWSGTGITSSEANYDAYFGSSARAVGWADQSDVGVNSFEGDSADVFDGDEVMIKFTYYGDTDLDGRVASSDSANFSTGVHLTGNAYWEFGDFDYSGGKPTASDSQAFSTGLAAYKTFGQL